MPERARRWSGTLWLALVAFGLIFGAFLLWEQQSRRGVLEAEYSTDRADRLGAKALFEVLVATGKRPARWHGEFSALPSPGLLFLLAPPEERGSKAAGELLPYEITALDEWVRRGNTVVVMSATPNSLSRALGLRLAGGRQAMVARPAQPGPLAAGVGEIRLPAGRAFELAGGDRDRDRDKDKDRDRDGGRDGGGEAVEDEDEESSEKPAVEAVDAREWVVLFGTGAAPAVVMAERGRGRYVAVADPYPASNRGLGEGDDLRFMSNLASLAGDGALLFDEGHHRAIRRGFMAYARARRLTPFLLYALALFALVLWRGGVRFGPPVPLVPEEGRDSGEYVRAVAALYESAGMARDALAANYETFRRRAAAALRLGSAWRPEEVAERLGARGRPAPEIARLLAEVEAAIASPSGMQPPPALSAATAFALAQQVAQLEAGLAPRRGSA